MKAAQVGVWFGLAALLFGCGGGGGDGGHATTGALTLRATWAASTTGGALVANARPPGCESREDVPPSVSTVEVRVGTGGTFIRRFVDPTVTCEVVVDGLQPGAITVQVLGYDVAFANRQLITQA